MNNNLEKDVRDFHFRFRQPHPPVPTAVHNTDPVWVKLRKDMGLEEAVELNEAIDLDDLGKIARECVDLVYIGIGTAVTFGIPFQACWDAVHSANMEKLPPPNKGDKPLKPENWISPDASILNALRSRTLAHAYGAGATPRTAGQKLSKAATHVERALGGAANLPQHVRDDLNAALKLMEI